MSGEHDPGGTPVLAMPKLTPAVKGLLIAFAVCFIAELADVRWSPDSAKGWLTQRLVLYPREVLWDLGAGAPHRVHLQLWRLVTYPFVQPTFDPTSLLFSGITLYFFGTDLEALWGARRFLLFSLANVLFAGLVATAYGAVHSMFFTQPVAGMMPFAIALTAAWGTRFPKRRLLFPPVSGRVLVWITLGLVLFQVVSRAASESPAPAVASALSGFALARVWDRVEDYLDRRHLAKLKAKRDALAGGSGRTNVVDIRSARRDRPKDKRFLN